MAGDGCSFVECAAFYLGKGKVDHIISWQEIVTRPSDLLNIMKLNC